MISRDWNKIKIGLLVAGGISLAGTAAFAVKYEISREAYQDNLRLVGMELLRVPLREAPLIRMECVINGKFSSRRLSEFNVDPHRMVEMGRGQCSVGLALG
jgi:hypothetical protein